MNINYTVKNNVKFFSIDDISSYLFNNTGFKYDVDNFLHKTKKKINYFDQDEQLYIEGKCMYDVFDHFESIFSYEQSVKIKNIMKQLRNIGIYKTKRRLNSCKLYIMYKQKYQCNTCKILLTPYCEIDHILALHKGGKDEIENLQALCSECHDKKTYQETFKDFVI